MKKTSAAIMLISLAVLFTISVCLFASVMNGVSGSEGSVGIIGGADGPTAILVLRTMNPWLWVQIYYALVTFVCALFTLIFPHLVKRVCRMNTTLTALGLSAVGAVGFFASVMLFSCFFLTSPDKHPIRYPISGVVCTLALCAFVFLLWLYVRFRSANKSVLGFFLDVAVALLYFFPFALLVSALAEAVTAVLQNQIMLQNLTNALFCGMMMLR